MEQRGAFLPETEGGYCSKLRFAMAITGKYFLNVTLVAIHLFQSQVQHQTITATEHSNTHHQAGTTHYVQRI